MTLFFANLALQLRLNVCFQKEKKVWKQVRFALMVSTLKSILIVRINLEFSCNFLKSQPILLRKCTSQDKYDFKQRKPVDTASSGAMSVDVVTNADND